MDSFAYNMTRWSLFTWRWDKPFYFYKQRAANCALVAPRELTIKALEERFDRYPDGLPWRDANELGTSRYQGEYDKRDYQTFYTHHPVLQFQHDFSSVDRLQRKRRKKPWPVQAFDIPYWGRAEKMRGRFYG